MIIFIEVEKGHSIRQGDPKPGGRGFEIWWRKDRDNWSDFLGWIPPEKFEAEYNYHLSTGDQVFVKYLVDDGVTGHPV
jgi:hypothetical protein